MKGLSLKAIERLEDLIDHKFNSISLSFLGLVPKLTKEKRIVLQAARSSLTSLFLQALDNRNPNQDEEETLKVMLRVASGYVDALRDRTKSKIVHSIDGYIREQGNKQKDLSMNKIQDIMDLEMDKAKKHFKMIVNSESNKAINTGTALQISKMAEQRGIEDPIVFFVVTVDDVTGPEEFILHLLPDRKTPRVWKLSEIGSEYHKKGDSNPKFSGLHPNCRCKLTYLAPGFGFNVDGYVTFKGLDWDEYSHQRGEYGVPRELNKAGILEVDLSKNEVDFTTPPTKHGEEHPNNINEPDTAKHYIGHVANNGELLWKQKHLKFEGRNLTPSQHDDLHRVAWKKYAIQNNRLMPKGSAFRNTLVGLNKLVMQDNDRHLKRGRTGVNPDPNHQELRQRHLIQAFGGREGYSIEQVFDPTTKEHLGVRIKAPRHHKSGHLGETSWFFDGKTLKTEYDKKTGKMWK